MDRNHTYRTHSPEETQLIAEKLAADITPGFICLYGDLGSGKTTFAQGFAKGLGIKERVVSPTFTLMREYSLDSRKRFYHIDMYRTEAADHTFDISEMIQDSNIVLIEWAERIKEKLPKQRIDIYFENNDDGSHTITVQKI